MWRIVVHPSYPQSSMSLRLTPSEPTSSSSTLLSSLNPEQAKAVQTTKGPLLIIAGAGSGKTRVLTVRLAHLLQSGVSASAVLALTFTNKAAQEMKERIGKLVGSGAAHGVWAGTFHSVFARILRNHAERIGHTNAFTIYDAEDQLGAVKAAMTMLGVSQQVLNPSMVRSRISAAKNAMTSWQELDRQARSAQDRQVAQIYAEYEKRLRAGNSMDFDDLLLNMIRLLENHADVLDQYQERFTYIMVDEYQDTNRAQYRVVNMLARKYRNICVVGDDAQSIYRWRGAEIKNILDFERDYPEATVVRLEQNYRSTKTILAAADAVIKNNSNQLKKQLWTQNPDGEKITLLACRDDREEATSIASTIRSRMEKHGYSHRDVAILYRTNAQSQALEDALRRDNIPYHIVSGVSFYKRKEVKDTLAYLRLLVNPNDAESLLRVINEPTRGIGATSIQRIQAHAAKHGISMFQAMEQAQSIEGLQRRIETAALEFTRMISEFAQQRTLMPPHILAQTFLDATGLLQLYQSQDNAEAQDRWNNIDRVLSHIAEQTELNPDLTLVEYLEQVSLVSEQDDPELGSNRIALMTMHAAKGLEFPLVVIAGMEQGLFPLSKAETDLNEQEEERRLFYVGITRACEQLVLSYADRRFRFGEVTFSRPSMFLAEISPECFSASSAIKVGGSGTVQSRHSPQNRSATNALSSYAQDSAPEGYSQLPPSEKTPSRTYRSVPTRPSQAANAYRTGMRVKHPMFGVGQIESVSGSGANAKATVMFFSGQRKNLMLAYARLEIL